MTKDEIKNKVLSYEWEYWFDRPFGAFLMSLFKDGQTRKYMRKVGVDAEWPAILFQNGAWYKSVSVWDAFEIELEEYLKEGGEVAKIVRRCEEYANEAKERIKKLERSNTDLHSQLLEVYDVLTQVISFVWLAHGFEHLFAKKLRTEVPLYMSGNVEKNIGDISFPKKKNAHYYFVKDLKSNKSLEGVRKNYGWIKARGGFSSGFSIKELQGERGRLQKEIYREDEFIHPLIPKQLQDLAEIAQDLVYFRTLRTDILYELIWIARPILSNIASSFNFTFNELRDYSASDLLEGKIEKYEYDNFSAISYSDNFSLFHGTVLDKKLDLKGELKGTVSYRGVARGIIKVVKVAHEIDKVKKGDIIVAPTTAPSYIIGMQKAAAFITDEGGITSHAAITSREMKKPCIIGTKIATKVLKDGDLVEVDAENGIVKILNNK